MGRGGVMRYFRQVCRVNVAKHHAVSTHWSLTARRTRTSFRIRKPCAWHETSYIIYSCCYGRLISCDATPYQLIICRVPALFLAEPGDGVGYMPRLWVQRSFGSTATVASVWLGCDSVVLHLVVVSMCFCETLVTTCQVTV